MKPIVIKRNGSKASLSGDWIQSVVETAANVVNKEIAIYALNSAIAVGLKMCEQDSARHVNNILMFVPLLLMLPLCRRTPRVYSNVSDALFRLCLKRPKNRSPPIVFNY